MRPRIAVTLTQCWHAVPGGTATAAIRTTAALVERDEFDLIGIGPRGGAPSEGADPPIPVEHLRLPYQLLYEAWHLGLEPPERVSGPVDVVHSTVPMTPPVRRAALVSTVHDLFPLLEPATLTPRGVRLMTKAFRLMREHATLVLCSSRQTLDDCVDAGFDPERLRLVPLGATPAVVDDDDRRRVRSTYGLERPYLVWVGTLEPRKNLPVLLQAFRQAAASDVELVLIGPDGWNLDLEALLADTDRLGTRSRVRRLGRVPADDLPVLLDGAIALAYPSRREGFGLPAVEAMAQGTPVIGAADTAIAEVVGDTGLLVDPNDVDAWTDALRMAMADTGWAADRDGPARERARQFTWERTAALTADAYREAMTLPRP